MPITVTSTPNTQTAEALQKGSEQAHEEVSEETKSVSTQTKSDETHEASDTSEAPVEKVAEAKGDSEETEEGDSHKEEKKPKRNGVQKRIDKLTSRLSAKDEEIEYLRQENLRLKMGKNPEPEKREKSSDEPKESDFENHADYIRAVARFEAKQEFAKEQAQRRDDQLKGDYQKRLAIQAERNQKFAKDHPDFADVMADLPDDFRVSPALEELILSSEHGSAFMYETIKADPEEFIRISRLSPLDAAREFGKFEARLNKSESPQPNEVKKPKPAPLKTVGSGPSGSSTKLTIWTAKTQAEYEQVRKEQMAKKRSAWG